MPAPPDLTFDCFTPTRGVRRALALGMALAEETPDAPRLLLLHGPPGVGKTHLLRAIINLRMARQPRRSLILFEASHLVQQWVADLKGDPEAARHRRLEWTGLVAIDDPHALAGKPVTQREVARTLEGTVTHGGRVACAMGGSPAEILDVMARAEHLTLRRETLAAIADRCEGDVRRGQGERARCPFDQSHPLARGSLRAKER
jgi:chromosomal replication initiation ATPase DnaA